jgi:hypothetical protein
MVAKTGMIWLNFEERKTKKSKKNIVCENCETRESKRRVRDFTHRPLTKPQQIHRTLC